MKKQKVRSNKKPGILPCSEGEACHMWCWCSGAARKFLDNMDARTGTFKCAADNLLLALKLQSLQERDDLLKKCRPPMKQSGGQGARSGLEIK